MQSFLYGAAQESNLPSVGLPRLTGFEGPPAGVPWGARTHAHVPPGALSYARIAAVRYTNGYTNRGGPVPVAIGYSPGSPHCAASRRWLALAISGGGSSNETTVHVVVRQSGQTCEPRFTRLKRDATRKPD